MQQPHQACESRGLAWLCALSLAAVEAHNFGLSSVAALLVQVAIAVVSALVMGSPTARRLTAVALALLGLGWTFVWPAHMSSLRAILTVMALLSVMRSLDLAADGANWSWRHRIWQMVGVIDIRELQRRDNPAADWRIPELLGAVFYLFAAVSLVSAAVYVGQFDASWIWPVRWLCGAGAMYCVPEATQLFLRFFYGALGYDTPPLHRSPALACSIREFWGERWNLVVHRWLRRHFFWPLARKKRRGLGVALAFLASAALHAWFIFAAVGWPLAGAMGAFFMLQGILVIIEAQLGWAQRDTGLSARVWTLGGVLLPSPLFVEPALQIFALHFPEWSAWLLAL